MARDITPRNDSDINSPDFERINKSHIVIAENKKKEKEIILLRLKEFRNIYEQKVFVRKVIFEKYKDYSKKEYQNIIKKMMYKAVEKRIINMVSDYNKSNYPIDIYNNKISSNIKLDTSKIITIEDETIEYYKNLNVEF
jgi:hypothetical protein